MGSDLPKDNGRIAQSIIIVASGESLKGFDFDLLNNQKNTPVMAVNYAYEVVSYDYHVFMDRLFYDDIKEDKNDLDLNKCYTSDRICFQHIEFAKKFTQSGLHGISRISDRITWTYNTGVLAIKIAIALGFKKLYLLGYDGGFKKDIHFYPLNYKILRKRYPGKTDPELKEMAEKRYRNGLKDNMPHYLSISNDMIDEEIYIVGPSEIICFDKMSFNDFKFDLICRKKLQ